MRAFTTPQQNLLNAPAQKANLLVTFYLDEGTYRFCDDTIDLTDGVNTYIGANSLSEEVEITSGNELAAESITLVLDGLRMAQYGIDDPARVLSDILGYLYSQRRVDFALGLRYPDEPNITMSVPLYAGKINYARLLDREIQLDGTETSTSAKLEIIIDSLAARYNRALLRVRAHEDQLEIDPTDQFFSFVSDAIANERKLYWGKASPYSGGYAGEYSGGGAAEFGQRNVNRDL